MTAAIFAWLLIAWALWAYLCRDRHLGGPKPQKRIVQEVQDRRGRDG